MSGPRVLLCGRPNLLTKPGGDTRQIQGLLRHLSTPCTLSLELRPDLDGFDLVHVFNLSRPVEPAIQAAHARAAGLPVVCTPIYQDLWEYNRRGRFGIGGWLFKALGEDDARIEDLRALVNLARSGASGLLELPALWRAFATRRGARGAVDLQRQILDNSKVVLFNSTFEADTLRSCIRPRPRTRTSTTGEQYSQKVVPVGIDPSELSSIDPGPFCRRFGLAPGFVLSVGRLEDLKNQLSLVRALEDEPLELVLVGQPNPLHTGYGRALARAVSARPRTLLLRDLDRALLLSAMKAAAVHVLPSWFETAGLTSLEAAVAGCAVVSTDRGYAAAYLEHEAHYCDPGDLGSIRRAVRRALAAGPSEKLRQRVLERFTEERSAAEVGRVYSGIHTAPAKRTPPPVQVAR